MLKAYKYRLYPTLGQSEMIDNTIHACRLVYNLGLELRIWAYKNGIKLSNFDLQRQLKDLRKEYDWLKSANSQALYKSLDNLDLAYHSFFRGGGFPKFKKKTKYGAFCCHNNTRRLDWEASTVTIPKIKDIPIVLSRKFDGDIRTIIISKTNTGKYFAAFVVYTEHAPIEKKMVSPKTTIGIDVGIKSFAVTSDGRNYTPNRKLKDNMKRLQCLQRRASRKKKGSGNRKKANKQVALLYEKITNQRADYIHKITTQLIRDNQVDTFVVENLNVVGMMKNEKLSQAIADVSFGEFFRQMKYKCDWYGKNLIAIGRFAPSSKRCSECGTINESLTLADREWACECGAHHDRDLNAAKNIKFFGLNTPVGSRGEPVESRRLRRAKKQERVFPIANT